MKKKGTLKITLSVLFIGMVIFAAWKFKKQTPEKMGLVQRQNQSPLFEPHDKSVTIFLKAVELETGRPYNITTTIRQSKSRFNQMKQAVLAFIQGPRSGKFQVPVPEGLSLNEFYFTPQGLAVVDLSTTQMKKESFGFFEETVFVRGIIEVLSRNFFEIKQVKILVDGQDAPTIAGHYALGTADVSVSVPMPEKIKN